MFTLGRTIAELWKHSCSQLFWPLAEFLWLFSWPFVFDLQRPSAPSVNEASGVGPTSQLSLVLTCSGGSQLFCFTCLQTDRDFHLFTSSRHEWGWMRRVRWKRLCGSRRPQDPLKLAWDLLESDFSDPSLLRLFWRQATTQTLRTCQYLEGAEGGSACL